MKKELLYLLLLQLGFCNFSNAQSQLKNWYMGPVKINMTTLPPVPSAIIPFSGTAPAATAQQVANGYYDNAGNGNLLFYIADNKVYDHNNILIGTIPTGGAEVAIVPFGNNNVSCQNKYNLFSTDGGVTKPVELFQTVLDMNNYSLSPSITIDGVSYGTEFGAIAVGRQLTLSLDRFLYFLVGGGTINSSNGQINKLIIHNDGTVSTSVALYPTATITNANAGGEVFTKELEISPDGAWMAWASYANGNYTTPAQKRYHFLALNSNGDLDIVKYGAANVYQQFNIQNANYNLTTAGFRGIEFYQSGSTTKLFMGAGTDGIFSTNISIPFTNSFAQVTGSDNSIPSNSYGFSQIELAYNGWMYASSGKLNNNIGAFYPIALSPQIATANSFTLANPPKDVYSLAGTNPNSILYTLPDQIDGQNYNNIVYPPLIQIPTLYTVTAVSGHGLPQ